MYIKTDSYLACKHLFSFQYTVIRLSFDSYIHCRIHVPIRNQPKMRRSEAMKIRQPERRRYRYGEDSIPREKMQYIFKNSCLLNKYRCNSKDILIEQRTQKKKILQHYADPLYLIPSNPCNAISKCSSIGTRILISLTWRTRCIRNAPCRCIAYAVSSFSAGASDQYPFLVAASFFNKHSYKSEAAGTLSIKPVFSINFL